MKALALLGWATVCLIGGLVEKRSDRRDSSTVGPLRSSTEAHAYPVPKDFWEDRSPERSSYRQPRPFPQSEANMIVTWHGTNAMRLPESLRLRWTVLPTELDDPLCAEEDKNAHPSDQGRSTQILEHLRKSLRVRNTDFAAEDGLVEGSATSEGITYGIRVCATSAPAPLWHQWVAQQAEALDPGIRAPERSAAAESTLLQRMSDTLRELQGAIEQQDQQKTKLMNGPANTTRLAPAQQQ